MEQDYRENWYAFIIFFIRLYPVELAFAKLYKELQSGPEKQKKTADGEWVEMLINVGFKRHEIARAFGVKKKRVDAILREWRKQRGQK